MNIGVRANAQWGPRVFTAVIRSQITGPGAAALLANCQASYDQASRSEGVTGGQPLGNVHVAEEAFRWVAYTPAAAVIDLVSAGPGAAGDHRPGINPAAGRLGRRGLEGDRAARWRLGKLSRRTVLAQRIHPVPRPGRRTLMWCPTLITPECLIAGQVIGAAASSAGTGALNGIASAVQDGISWMVTQTVTWWVQVPSPDLAGEPAVGRLQQLILPVAVAVAVFGVIIAGGRMALTRKANPLIDVGSGLVVIAATSAVGVLLPSLLVRAGDAWSSWALQQSTGGQFAARLTSMLTLNGASPAVIVVLGIVAIIISAVQAVLMLFRQGALVVLAGVLPLAAAGMMNPGTRTWFRRVTGWMLALIFYKPAAAAVYATAFTMIGAGKDTRTVLVGFAMVFLSLLALPVLMRLFSWTTGHVADSAGGGGFLQAALGGAVAIGALRGSAGGSGGSGAVEQARLVSARLGPQDPGPSGASAPGAGLRRAAASGAGAAPGAATAAGAAGQATAAGAAADQPASPRLGWRRARRVPAAGRPRSCSRRTPAEGDGVNDQDTPGPRDYGGWRRRRGIGLFGLGAAGTLAVLGALLALIIAATADAAALLYIAPPVLLAGGLGLARIGGEPLAVASVRRLRWQYGSARNYTRYRAAVVAEHSPAFPMPGALAPLTLLDAEDGCGGRYGIVLDRRTGLMTPTLRVIPASTWLANREDADTWVANWGGWLASLGFLPMVRWVTVTVDTAPEPGSTLADSVTAALDPASPLAARQIMGQLVQAAPAAAADVDTRVSITFDPKASPAAPAGLMAAAAEVGRIMHGLESALGTCGVTRAGPGQRDRDRRRGPHRLRPGRPRRRQPHRGPGGHRAPGPGVRLGRRRPCRGGRAARLVPARQRHQRDMGLARGTTAGGDRRRAGPPGRTRPLPQAGQPAVPAVPGRRGHPRPGS